MKSKGFTLIELVVVIVILGILAAIAIPKYIDITEHAEKAHDRGQLSALRGSTHILYAKNILTNASALWPSEIEVWENLTQSNTWKTTDYQNHCTYDGTGVWAVTNGAE